MDSGGQGVASLQPVPVSDVLQAFDDAMSAYTLNHAQRSAMSAAITRAYVHSFAQQPDQQVEEAGFPPAMPYYFRHTARFNNHNHARALMCVRCVSTPFAACPSSFKPDKACVYCRINRAHPTPAETVEHVVFDCPGYASLRSDVMFSSLFQHPSPPSERMRQFVTQERQHCVAAFFHSLFQKHAEVCGTPSG